MKVIIAAPVFFPKQFVPDADKQNDVILKEMNLICESNESNRHTRAPDFYHSDHTSRNEDHLAATRLIPPPIFFFFF